MPNPPKALPDGRRGIVKATFREVVPARPSLEGGPFAPRGSVKPFRHREHWSLSEYVLALGFIPIYLYRTTGLFRTMVLFMVIWIAFGQLTIWLDFGYNHELRTEMAEEGNRAKTAMLYMGNGNEVPHQCRLPWIDNNPPQGWPLESVEEGLNPAGFPFGKLYMFGTSCTTEIGKNIFGWIGADDYRLDRGFGGWLNDRYEDAMWSYAIERRLSFSYVLLGFLALIDIALFLPWLVIWGSWQVITRLNFTWE